MTQFIPAKKKREIKEDDLQLEPLCAEVLDFTMILLQEIKVSFQGD